MHEEGIGLYRQMETVGLQEVQNKLVIEIVMFRLFESTPK